MYNGSDVSGNTIVVRFFGPLLYLYSSLVMCRLAMNPGYVMHMTLFFRLIPLAW